MQTNKDIIETGVKSIGVATAILYVYGFIADRVHWNLLGYVQAPTDHMEFLYRGGVVVLATIASVLEFAVSLCRPCVHSSFLWLGGLFLLTASRFIVRWKSQYSRWFLYGGTVCVVSSTVIQLLISSEVSRHALFEQSAEPDLEAYSRVFYSYVGIGVLWFVLWSVARWRLRLGVDLPTQLIYRLARAATIVALVFLPIVYGGYQYPWVYPVADIHFSDNAADTVAGQSATGGAAILFETHDDVVLFGGMPLHHVWKVKKSLIDAISVRGYAHITCRQPLVSCRCEAK